MRDWVWEEGMDLISYIKSGEMAEQAHRLWERLESGQTIMLGWTEGYYVLERPCRISEPPCTAEHVKVWSVNVQAEVWLTRETFLKKVKEEKVVRIYNPETWGRIGS